MKIVFENFNSFLRYRPKCEANSNLIKIFKFIINCKLGRRFTIASDIGIQKRLNLLVLNGIKLQVFSGFWKVQWINRKWYVMQNYVLIIFLRTFPYQLLYLSDKFKKTDSFAWNCRFFKNCWWNTTARMEKFTEN